MIEISILGFITILDYLGTVAFAVTGASRAIAYKVDIFGVVTLATAVGVAGGVMRDIVFGRPATALSDPIYVTLTVATGIVVFFSFSKYKKHIKLWLVFDAIGLGVFSIIGATIAYQIVGMNLLSMQFAGMITAIGGGVVRDVVIREIPTVFVKDIYAVASLAGITIFYALLYFGMDIQLASVIGISFVTGIRLLAMKFKWHLPIRKNIED